MTVRKLSVALEEHVAYAAREAATRRGMSLSAWLSEASRHALVIDDGLAAVSEWESEMGSLSPEELAAADASLDAAGIGRAP